MDEIESIARLKRGDPGGLEGLVKAYQLRAVRTAYLITRDRALAEDVAQAAFLRAYERIDQFDASRPFGPWFMTMVVRDAVKAATRRERQVSLDEPDSATAAVTLADSLADAEPGPEELLLRAEGARELWQVLGSLSPAQRAAVVLHYYRGLSVAESAEQLHCSNGTVKAHLFAARERLRLLLAPAETFQSRSIGKVP